MKARKISESAYRARVKEQIEGRKGVIDFESLGRTLAYSPFLPRLTREDLARDSMLGASTHAQGGGNEVRGVFNASYAQGAEQAQGAGAGVKRASNHTGGSVGAGGAGGMESRTQSHLQSHALDSDNPRNPHLVSHNLRSDSHILHKGVSLPHIAYCLPITAHDEPTRLLHYVSALESAQGAQSQGALDSMDSAPALESRQKSYAPHALAQSTLESPQALSTPQAPRTLDFTQSPQAQSHEQSKKKQAPQGRKSTSAPMRPAMLMLDMRALYESESLDSTASLLGLESISLVRRHSSLPIIHADIFLDPYQILESALFGADALLLPARGLDSKRLRELLSFASRLGLECFVEVGDKSELKTAIFSGARMLYMADSALKSLLELVPNSQIIASDSTQEYGVDVWIRGCLSDF